MPGRRIRHAHQKDKNKYIFEVEDIQVDIRTIIDAVKSSWSDLGYDNTEMSDLTLYIKSEDKRAYFIGNDRKVSGHVELSNAIDLADAVCFSKITV